MSRMVRPALLLLLCFLVVSWGACPCVYAHMVGTSEEEPAEAPPPACCCGQVHEDEPAEGSEPDPGECPCCSKGGALRDLPPQGDAEPLDDALPVLEAAPLVASGDARGPGADLERTHQEGTGPPLGNALHACPVGIVLLLS